MLAIDKVGADDSFFDLGGDSLSAMRLIAAVNNVLDADLSVRAVFEAPRLPNWRPVSVKARAWSRWCRRSGRR